MHGNDEKGTRHHNKFSLESILTKDVKNKAGDKGSSLSYAPEVDGQKYHVKAPNFFTCDPETYTGTWKPLPAWETDDKGDVVPADFSPANKRLMEKVNNSPQTKRGAFDPNILHNQEFVVKKALFVNALLNALGIETGELQHWYGKAEGEKYPQHYLASKIEHQNQTICDVTNTKIVPGERLPMTEFEGAPIEGASVIGKKMTGFGEYVAIADLVYPKDGHGSNFLLVDKLPTAGSEKGTIELIPFDGSKASCGSGLNLEHPYFGYNPVTEASKLEKEAEKQDKLYNEREALTNPKNEKIFNETFSQEIQVVNQLLKDECFNDVEQYLKSSKVLFPLASLQMDIVTVIAESATAKDFHPQTASKEDGLMDLRTYSMQSDKARIENLRNMSAALKGEGTIENRLRYSFPSQKDYPDTVGTSLNVFKFPFPEDFHKAAHVKNGYLDKSYQIMQLDMEKVGNEMHNHMGDRHAEGTNKILAEMQNRQNHLKETLGKNPEYRAYVEANKDRLEKSMPAVYETLHVKLEGYKELSESALEVETPVVAAGKEGGKRAKEYSGAAQSASTTRPAVKPLNLSGIENEKSSPSVTSPSKSPLKVTKEPLSPGRDNY